MAQVSICLCKGSIICTILFYLTLTSQCSLHIVNCASPVQHNVGKTVSLPYACSILLVQKCSIFPSHKCICHANWYIHVIAQALRHQTLCSDAMLM